MRPSVHADIAPIPPGLEPLLRLTSSRFSRLTIGLAIAAIVLGGAGLFAWINRWQVSRRAVEIADPVVRRWATKEVARLSEGAYRLTASTIHVDAARRRIGIDTVIVITDPVANAKRREPLPSMTLRFRNCALEGIDLQRLAQGRGLHVTRTGCDTVILVAEVPTPTGATSTSDSGGFLTLRRNLDLPRNVPFVRIDTVAFPQVRLALGIGGRSGRRTAVAFDRLAVRFDSLHYDPKEPLAKRSTLLSRDATVTLEGFEGTQELANRLAIRRLFASLGRRTIELDGLKFEPIPGGFSDSLGFTALAVERLHVRDVDWRAFLTRGDVHVGAMRVDTASLHVSAGSVPPGGAKALKAAALAVPHAPRTVEGVLRALDRAIRLDTFQLTALSLIEGGAPARDSAVTTIAELAVLGARFDNDSALWASALPVGPLQVDARRVVRRTATGTLSLARLGVDVASGRIDADSLHVGPLGDDAAFLRRQRWRRSRSVLDVGHAAITGASFPDYLRRGRYAIRRATVTGFALDVLEDKGKPSNPAKTRRRIPQTAVRDLGLWLHADTVTVAGRLQYRERGAEAPAPGVLTFEQLRATMTNVSTDPARMTDSTPLHFRADARLMGVGPLHLEVEMPLLDTDFDMTWRGSLGPMDPMKLNPFLANATGMRFTSGHVSGVRFASTVVKGRSRGTVAPRWEDFGVELPGVARKQTNLLGSIKRALAKFAANAFVVRDDNPETGKPPLDGTITHAWSPTETLPQFFWKSLRDALLPLLKH